MMTGMLLADNNTINPTAVIISVGIPPVVCAAIAVVVWAYFRLQDHRADAVAMAHYRSSPRTLWPTSRSCALSWPS